MSKNKLETVAAQTQRKKIKSMDVFLHNTHTLQMCAVLLLICLLFWSDGRQTVFSQPKGQLALHNDCGSYAMTPVQICHGIDGVAFRHPDYPD